MNSLLVIVAVGILSKNILVDAGPIVNEMVDMTYVYDNITVYWPKIPPYELVVLSNGTSENGYWVQTEKHTSGTHVGTHMDAPCHFSKGGLTVDKIPLDHLVAPAAVIDIIDKAEADRDYLVQVKDLLNWEIQTGLSLDGTIVMLKSGWGRRWPDRESFTGTPKEDVTKLHSPGMSEEACKWLVLNRKVFGLGTETMSVDNGPSQTKMAHRTLLGANLFGLENVANMEKLPAFSATLHVMPMKIGYACGAPVRIIANFPKTKVK